MDEVEVAPTIARHLPTLTSPFVLRRDLSAREPVTPVGRVLSTRTSIGLTIHIVADVDAVAALRPDYRRLERAACVQTPFSLFEWHLAWCRHFLIRGRHVDMQPRFYVLRDADDVCVAIVPLILTRRRLGLTEIAAYDMLGADPAMTEIRAPLIERGYESRVAWLLQQRLRQLRRLDWVHWMGINGPFGETLAVGAELRWQEPLTDFVLDLPDSWERLRATLKRNIRESLRHCYNSLKRDGHEFSIRIIQQPDAVAEAVDRFLHLHAQRADVRGGVRHSNHFARATLRAFLHDVCARLAERGCLRIFQMLIAGQVVATRIGFEVGDSLYLYYSGYDPAWSRYSVMTTTVAEAIKYAISRKLATVNLSLGDDVSKTRWGPREVRIRHAVQISPSLYSRLTQALYQRVRQDDRSVGLLRRFAARVKRDWN